MDNIVCEHCGCEDFEKNSMSFEVDEDTRLVVGILLLCVACREATKVVIDKEFYDDDESKLFIIPQ